ncbi:MAG: hypothetical protein DRN05_07240, partial [Thermoplasmata archaeon]
MSSNYHQTGEKLTFWQLINKYKIEIPIMQRDYAQGREKHKDIRESFLTNIYKAINNNENLNLDFIYGSVEDIKENKLILIDGQQRITTLFLLHWYLVNKDNKVSDDVKSTLKRFTYETRISSREFVEKIIDKGIDFEQLQKSGKLLSQYIKDQPWFFIYWQRDPTIKAMLTMLDSIHEKFKEAGFFEKLIQSNNPPITFYFLQLENFGLTDELYIKMNARGKLLTEFENFKARFEQFWGSKFSNTPTEFKIKDKEVSFKEYFSCRIDNEWTDLFWEFRDENNEIDERFMNYFCYVTEMLYYEKNATPLTYLKDSSRPEIEIDFNEDTGEEDSSEGENQKRRKLNFAEVYKNKDNIKFLFKSLDKWLEIARGRSEEVKKENIKSLFDEIFSKGHYKPGKVTLWGDRNEEASINLFEKLITKNNEFTIFDKVILWTILKYLIENDKKQADDNLKDLVRVVRNLLIRIRTPGTADLRYRSTLGYKNLPHILSKVLNKFITQRQNIYLFLNRDKNEIKLSETGITEETFKHEVEKAKIIAKDSNLKPIIFQLEDYKYLRSDLKNFLPVQNEDNQDVNPEQIRETLENVKKVMDEVFCNDEVSDSLIIRALLTVPDESFEPSKWPDEVTHALWRGTSKETCKCFFGGKDGWEIILTADKNKKILKNFVEEYNEKGSLEKIINEFLSKSENNYDWRYYFVKYKEMTEDEKEIRYCKWGNNWEPKGGFEVENMFRSRIDCRHISPYVRTVVKRLNDNKFCRLDDCYRDDAEESFISLQLTNDITIKMYCVEEGWKIEFSENFNETKKNSLINKFNLKCENGYLLRTLKESSENKTKEDKTDRIEVAINFIKSLS